MIFVNTDEFTARAEAVKARLYRTAFLFLENETKAVDAVDEAIYKAYISLKKLRQPEFLETWLTRILINQCKYMLRRLKRETPLESLTEVQLTQAAENFDALPLKEAVRLLPQDLRDVIILRFFTGFTLAETAESLKIPQGSVVTRQRRALKLLRLELSDNTETLTGGAAK